MASPRRPQNRSVENENLKPGRDGEPPRPATEPAGARGSTRTGKTATDPATGAPQAEGDSSPA